MTSQKLKALEVRRHQLQLQAARERTEVALHFEPLGKPLSWADKGMDAIAFIKNTPLLWTGAFTLFAHFKPKLASKALAVGWGAMKVFKSAKTHI